MLSNSFYVCYVFEFYQFNTAPSSPDRHGGNYLHHSAQVLFTVFPAEMWTDS